MLIAECVGPEARWLPKPWAQTNATENPRNSIKKEKLKKIFRFLREPITHYRGSILRPDWSTTMQDDWK